MVGPGGPVGIEGGPVVGVFSQRLAEVVEHSERTANIAKTISEEVVMTYRRVLKNVPGSR